MPILGKPITNSLLWDTKCTNNGLFSKPIIPIEKHCDLKERQIQNILAECRKRIIAQIASPENLQYYNNAVPNAVPNKGDRGDIKEWAQAQIAATVTPVLNKEWAQAQIAATVTPVLNAVPNAVPNKGDRGDIKEWAQAQIAAFEAKQKIETVTPVLNAVPNKGDRGDIKEWAQAQIAAFEAKQKAEAVMGAETHAETHVGTHEEKRDRTHINVSWPLYAGLDRLKKQYEAQIGKGCDWGMFLTLLLGIAVASPLISRPSTANSATPIK